MNGMVKTGIVTVLIGSLGLGCASNLGKGAAIGSGVGGVLGAIIGKQYKKTKTGAIAGAAVGGAAGALIGKYMDEQAEKMKREVEDARIERVGEQINIVMDSGILFAFDSAELSSTARENVTKLASILNEYGETLIIVEGHTDSVGSDSYNQGLSERRAAAVSNYLAGRGVAAGRLTTLGFGESNPVASNDTEQGRAQNRRVEISVIANEDLREKAKAGQEL